MSLQQASVDRLEAQAGDPLRVRLDLQGHDLDREITLALGLLDASGTSWAEREARLGPAHQPSGTTLPETWSELGGLWLLPGIPPGDYILGLRVYGDGVDTTAAATHYGWVPLGSVVILPGLGNPELVGLLPQPHIPPIEHDGLRLVGLEPYATHYMEATWPGSTCGGSPPSGVAAQLEVRLEGRDEPPSAVSRWAPQPTPPPAGEPAT